MSAEHKPAPIPELLEPWDDKAFRRVRRHEMVGEVPRCAECGCNQEKSPTAHLPGCSQYRGMSRPEIEAAANLLVGAPVEVPPAESAEKFAEKPAESQVVIPEVMPPSAPVSQAGTIDVTVDAPTGTEIRLNIRLR